MMRNDVNLFRNDFDNQMPDEEQPNFVGKSKSVMRAIAVQVNRAMSPQKHHAINKTYD